MFVNYTRGRLGGARMATRRRLGPLMEMAEQGGAEGVGGGDGERSQVTAERLRAAGLDAPALGARRFWTRRRVNDWVCSVSSQDPRLLPAQSPTPNPDLQPGPETDQPQGGATVGSNVIMETPEQKLIPRKANVAIAQHDAPARIRTHKPRRVKRQKISIGEGTISFRKCSSQHSDEAKLHDRKLMIKEQVVKDVTQFIMDALPFPKSRSGRNRERRTATKKSDELAPFHGKNVEGHDILHHRRHHHHHHHLRHRRREEEKETALPHQPHTPEEIREKREKHRIHVKTATAKAIQVPVIPVSSMRWQCMKPELMYKSRAHKFPYIKTPPHYGKYTNAQSNERTVIHKPIFISKNL